MSSPPTFELLEVACANIDYLFNHVTQSTSVPGHGAPNPVQPPTSSKPFVVVIGHVLLLSSCDGVVVLGQRDRLLQRVRGGT